MPRKKKNGGKPPNHKTNNRNTTKDNPTKTKEDQPSFCALRSLVSLLATLLRSKHLVASSEEATSLAEAIGVEIEASDLSRDEACRTALEEYCSVSRHEANGILAALLTLERRDKDSDDDDSDDSDGNSSAKEAAVEETNSDDDDSSDDDGECIGEGECELCERYIKLTHHHLIPKSTWPRILPKLSHAAQALDASHAMIQSDVHRASLILGPGLSHFMEPLTILGPNKAVIKKMLLRQTTASICRPCHSTLHRTHSNMDLALHYSSTELLLADPQIYKYSKWANKQKK